MTYNNQLLSLTFVNNNRALSLQHLINPPIWWKYGDWWTVSPVCMRPMSTMSSAYVSVYSRLGVSLVYTGKQSRWEHTAARCSCVQDNRIRGHTSLSVVPSVRNDSLVRLVLMSQSLLIWVYFCVQLKAELKPRNKSLAWLLYCRRCVLAFTSIY